MTDIDQLVRLTSVKNIAKVLVSMQTHSYNLCTMNAVASARRSAILEVLAQDGFMDVSALQERFGCSEATIRRDLHLLHRAGQLRRTHGGAVLEGPRERPLTTKLNEMAEAKQAVAQASLELVIPGLAVGFTGGTTTQYVARALASRTGAPVASVTVVTNAINIAMELAGSGLRIIVTGGELRGETFELVGPLAEPAVAQLHLDLMFVGVDGLSIEGGLTTHNPIEARIDQFLIERSNQVIVVADHTKLGRKTFAQIAAVDVVHTLITDTGADPRMVSDLERVGMRVILAHR